MKNVTQWLSAMVFAAGAGLANAGPIVTVGALEWLQPLDFADSYSWDDISAVCDPTSGACNGFLGGNLLTGWTWASVSDINALFNFFIGPAVVGPGPAEVSAERTDWVGLMTTYGFTASSFSDPFFVVSSISGILRDTDAQGEKLYGQMLTGRDFINFDGLSFASSNNIIASNVPGSGVWFVRAVPVTNTMALVVLGFCSLLFARRKRKQHI
jgi:hypothetical protein